MKAKQEKYRIPVWACFMVVSFLLAIICSLGIDTDVKKQTKHCFSRLRYTVEEKEYALSDMQVINSSKEGNKITSTTEDPQLVIEGIDRYVENVGIHFSTAMENDTALEIFYVEKGEGFSAEKMLSQQMQKGSTSVQIELFRKVDSLRIDLGQQAGISFDLQSVIVNDSQNGYTPAQTLKNELFKAMKGRIWLDRAQILFLVLVFISLHFLLGIKRLYTVLFEKRWIVAGVLLLFLVVNRYNGDSITMYDYYVQPGMGNEYVQPVFGQERGIRSDEWMVDTPIAMSTQYLDHPYGKYNDIIRGTETLNNQILSIGSISYPPSLIKAVITEVFGYDYGASFGWYCPIFLIFLLTIEFFLIITNRHRLLSVCGACMLVFSSFFLWWGFPSVFLGANGAVVCAYHFIQSKNWKKKILLAIGTCISTAYFILVLYPAWQVPLGYIILAVLVYLIHDNWSMIKTMSKKEWLTIVAAVAACIGIVLVQLISKSEYISAVMSTEYPGSRVEYGGFSIHKLFNYIPALLFAQKDYGNPSEAGTCVGFFPVPMLLGIYTWIRTKKKDWLVSGLLLVGIFLTIYTTVGLPPFLAKCTLMTFSTSDRAVGMLGYLQVVLFIRVLACMKEEERIPLKISVVLSILVAGIAVFAANKNAPAYMGKGFMLIMVCVLAFLFTCLISKVSMKWRNCGIIAMLIFAIVTGMGVRPITKGSDAITSKPLAKEIIRLAKENKDAKWLAVGGWVALPSFAVSCGAPTINSVNMYPNMELWQELDPEGKYNEVYNRYAHIDLQLVEEDTTMELIQVDSFKLNLSYKDISKTKAEYIVALEELQIDNQWLRLKEVYQEAGSYIYEIEYH